MLIYVILFFIREVTKNNKIQFSPPKFIKIKRIIISSVVKVTRKWSMVFRVDGSRNCFSGEQFVGF